MPKAAATERYYGEVVAVTTTGAVWKALLMAALTGYFFNLALRLARGHRAPGRPDPKGTSSRAR